MPTAIPEYNGSPNYPTWAVKCRIIDQPGFAHWLANNGILADPDKLATEMRARLPQADTLAADLATFALRLVDWHYLSRTLSHDYPDTRTPAEKAWDEALAAAAISKQPIPNEHQDDRDNWHLDPGAPIPCGQCGDVHYRIDMVRHRQELLCPDCYLGAQQT